MSELKEGHVTDKVTAVSNNCCGTTERGRVWNEAGMKLNTA